MKNLIAMAVCLILTACVLTGCRSTENKKTTDTTTTPSTMTMPSTTTSIAPTSEFTQPTGNAGIQDPPETSTMPGVSNGDMNENTENGQSRSRAHYPSVVGRN